MRLRKTWPFPSLGPGMFGCKDTQVQAKIVARQLQTMSVVDLLAMMPLVWGLRYTRSIGRHERSGFHSHWKLRDQQENKWE